MLCYLKSYDRGFWMINSRQVIKNVFNLKKKLWLKARAKKFKKLQYYGLANIHVNQRIYPVCGFDLSNNIEFLNINIGSDDIRKILSLDCLSKYRKKEYPHTKILEYLTSINLLSLENGDILLDAAGGRSVEYPICASFFSSKSLNFICQDSLPINKKNIHEFLNIKFVEGSIDNISIEDSSINAISCHHSFEHFQGDLDKKFLLEAQRVLKPGGRLVIVPFFLTNIHAEIWNRRPTEPPDSSAEIIKDWSAAFPGWGPYEGFARTYDSNAFKSRLLDSLDKDRFKVEIHRVYYEGEPCPDMKYSNFQPLANAEMKALRVTKIY